MRGFVQWTRQTPQDWEPFDSKDWRRLPKKSESWGGATLDDDPGWPLHICVHGMIISADMFATADRNDGGCEVIAANIDPNDWPDPTKYVQWWTFEPLQPDPAFGGRINTRISLTVYTDDPERRAVYENARTTAGPVVLKPFPDVKLPPNALRRYGLLIPDGKYGEHLSVRGGFRGPGWRDWGAWDGVDPARLDESGRVRPGA